MLVDGYTFLAKRRQRLGSDTFDRGVFSFIPQGGRDFDTGHRCLSEWATKKLMKGAVRQLPAAMDYGVPLRDLRVDLSRMPAIPKSRFVIANVRRAEHEADGGGKAP